MVVGRGDGRLGRNSLLGRDSADGLSPAGVAAGAAFHRGAGAAAVFLPARGAASAGPPSGSGGRRGLETMELSQIPAALQSRLRLSVIAALLSGPKKFRTLQDLTGPPPVTWANSWNSWRKRDTWTAKRSSWAAGPIPPIVCSPMGGSNLPSMWPCWNLFWPRQRRRSQRRKSCRSETSLRQLFWFAVKPSVGRGPRCVRSR